MDDQTARFTRRTTRAIAVVAAAATLVTSCGGGDDDSDDESSTTTSSSVVTTSTSLPTTTTTVATTTTVTRTTPPVSTTVPTPVACETLLEIGCEGAAVGRLQRLLRTRVDGSIAVDDVFGAMTEAALRSFEEFRCPASVCVVDGSIVVDGPEWQRLDGLPTTTTTTFEISA